MQEYKPSILDVVTILDVDGFENFDELGLKVKDQYMITYVFADGSCVLYKEHWVTDKEFEIYEYIIETEDVKHLSFLYSHMDSVDSKYDISYKDDDEEFYSTYENKVEHNFKVGDYIYFEDVRCIKLWQEAGLKNNTPYKISFIGALNNCPFIDTDIGDFELYPEEVMFMKKYEGDANMEKERKVEKVTEKEINYISAYLDDLAYDLAMDEALKTGDFTKAQEILDEKIKVGE